MHPGASDDQDNDHSSNESGSSDSEESSSSSDSDMGMGEARKAACEHGVSLIPPASAAHQPVLQRVETRAALPAANQRVPALHHEHSSSEPGRGNYLSRDPLPAPPFPLLPTKKISRPKRRNDLLSSVLPASLKKVKTEQGYPVALMELDNSSVPPPSSRSTSLPLAVAGGLVTQVVAGHPDLHRATAVTSPPMSVHCSFVVRIPIAEVKLTDPSAQQQTKPKATVEPYNVVRTTSSSRVTPQRRSNTGDSMAPDPEEGRGSGRSTAPNTHLGRPGGNHPGNRWDREERERRTYGIGSHGGVGEGRGGDYGGGGRGGGGAYSSGRGDYGGERGEFGGRGHGGWDREHAYRGGGTAGDDYWSDTSTVHDGLRMDPQRGPPGKRTYPSGHAGSRMDPEYYMQEARRRKKEADKIVVSITIWCGCV